jgi:hypothetical protein
VIIVEQGIGRREQKRSGEKIPLNFQKRIGTGVEDFSHQGVDGADQRRNQYQPNDVFV